MYDCIYDCVEAAVFALGSVDHSVSEVLKVADVHHVFDRVLPLQSKAMIHTRSEFGMLWSNKKLRILGYRC